MMQIKKYCLFLASIGLSSIVTAAQPTELDNYLVKKDILDSSFKIKNTTALNEILSAISEEDSRTLPFQVDQNMLMEKMQVSANKVEIEGIITTPDFAQFAESVGQQKVKQLIKNNSLQNCALLFEHQFQRNNPYSVNLKLMSTDQVYSFSIKNSECKF
ncbi:hypothetical protein [Acinetobacter sp. ANC 5054]|uniref:hypothetical protein n=1 Tax=Acinetobacter sp. ANC 5054 TaxID=1977877 RepID=UPI001D17BE4E|nr:hypothetical protein [Acinetobacter sp. ANC 5054]